MTAAVDAQARPAPRFPDDLIAYALDGRDWRGIVARGILGDPRAARLALQAVDAPELPYYRAVLAWLAHDDDVACRELEAIATAPAQSLLALIRQPRIQVVTQIPFTGAGAFRLLEGIRADPRFEIRNIGGGAGELGLRPYERLLQRVFDVSSVAFSVCAMAEWQHPPFDLPHLPFPTIGYTSDFDAQFMSVAPWLQAFDHVLVCDQEVECRDVRGLTGGSVHAFPLVFCAPTEAPLPGDQPRDIDLFFSGTLFSPYQPDKAALVHELLQIPGLRLALVDGHVSHEHYHALLARSRITQNFCRHPGAMLTRALESLSMGSIALVQEESVHRIWAGPEDGVVPFRPGRLAEAVHGILRDYDRLAAGCLATARRIRETFSAAAVASRFFRYATVLAAQPRGVRRGMTIGPLTQRRHVFLVGPRPSLAVAERQCHDHLTIDHAGLDPVERLNLRARERALLHGQALHELQPPPAGALAIEHAIDDLRRAAAMAPDALVIRFNLVRLLLHFGDAADRAEADALAAEAVAPAPGRWRADAGDDAYPWDFAAPWFNARGYLDAVIALRAGRSIVGPGLVDLIMASLHHYLAVRRESVADARRAVSLDPAFPYYALTLARLLARSEAETDRHDAAALLRRLTDASEIAGVAQRELEALSARLPADEQRRSPGSAAISRAIHAVLLAGRGIDALRSRYFAAMRSVADGEPVAAVPAAARAPRLSVLVWAAAGGGVRPVLTALAAQRLDRDEVEIVYVDCFEPAATSDADRVIACRQQGFEEHRLEALATALDAARGALVVVIEPGSRLPAEFLSRTLDTGYATPEDAMPAQQVTLGGWPDEAAPARWMAFPAAVARAAGGFDLHPFFSGARGIPLELGWRLQQFGVPVAVVDADGVRLGVLPAWWTLPPFTGGTALDVARVLWPRLFDERRVDALLPWREVQSTETPGRLAPVEPTPFGFNILRYQSQYVAVRQSLGPIDFTEGAATLQRRFGPENVVIGEDLLDVRRRAAAMASPGSPASTFGAPRRHVEHGREFRVAEVDGRFVAVRHAVGPINFDAVDDADALLAAFGPRYVVIAATREQLRDGMRALVGRPPSS